MIKKIMLASCLLVASMASQATLISYNGYERDSAKNFVTGGGLEWLMWDVTKGKSINKAVAEHGADGWLLASNTQMASLFNVFHFNNTIWHANERASQSGSSGWTPAEDGPYSAFLQLFGSTWRDDSNFHRADPLLETGALYGSDDNKDGRYNLVRMMDDASDMQSNRYSHLLVMYEDANYMTRDHYSMFYGVALVRDVRVAPPTQVSLPGSLSLLALGLVALGFRRRQALRLSI